MSDNEDRRITLGFNDGRKNDCVGWNGEDELRATPATPATPMGKISAGILATAVAASMLAGAWDAHNYKVKNGCYGDPDTPECSYDRIGHDAPEAGQ